MGKENKDKEKKELKNEALGEESKENLEEDASENVPDDEEKLTFEDKLEGAMDSVQDFFYGERKSFTEDIPATMETPQGIRKINKVQTRRNIHKKLFGKKGPIILLIILGVGVLIGLIITLIEKLLLL